VEHGLPGLRRPPVPETREAIVPDILHRFPIAAPTDRVFEAITTPAGLDQWWTARSTGVPRMGAVYQLWFGPEYDWRAMVTECLIDRTFELELTAASADWVGTRVRFELESMREGTSVGFSHSGWGSTSEHFRTSSFCWAMYLRILKRHLEIGERVSYNDRLSV
jgi:uncharacterized protein YndB with AHSA1/START domain